MSEDHKEHLPIDPQGASGASGEEEADLFHEFEFVSEDELTLGSTPTPSETPLEPSISLDAPSPVDPPGPVPTGEEEPVIDLYGSDAPPCPEEILEAAASHADGEVEAARPEPVNRPAEGARQALPGEVLSQGFQGSENAGDFLGLDLEFTAAASELELAEAPQAQPVSDEPATVPPSSLMETGEDVSGYAEADEDLEGYGEYGEGIDPELEGEPFDGEEAVGAGRGKILLAAGLFGALVVAGATLLPDLLGGGADPANGGPTPKAEVAARPKPKDTGLVGGAATQVAPTPAIQTDTTPGESAPVDLRADPTDAPSAASGPEVADTGVEAAPLPEGGAPTPSVGNGVSADPLGVLVDATPITDPIPSVDAPVLTGRADPAPGAADVTTEFPDFSEGFEWVTPDKLDMVWRGEEVPMEAIFAPARTLMPHVGNVRVHMRSGDTIEGSLYAVGEERVWIDMAPGRVGLDGREVVRFERLSAPVAASVGFISGEAPTSRERVRVQAPGGTFYGKVVAQEGSTVTLLQDGGGRIVLQDAVVEPAVRSRAIIVRR
ncbi:MAG TPA: hypothetical protein ENJ09_00665 [Planctomycetes bacterium]|nr:hypothetical protein [Planctomycetota bacterium]